MVKGISPKTPDDDSFIHQYAGGVNQYGTRGAQSPDSFQGHMNDGMTNAVTGSSQTPMDLMSSPSNPNFGPPPLSKAEGINGAAPENFGPPGISQVSADNQSSFGPPGFDQKPGEMQNVGMNSDKPNENINNLSAPPPSDQNNNLTSGTGGTTVGGSGAADGEKDKKKHSRKQVEKMMVDNMMQNVIANMKVKDPDPGAWK